MFVFLIHFVGVGTFGKILISNHKYEVKPDSSLIMNENCTHKPSKNVVFLHNFTKKF